jgi:branched-chain amino acid aminotransferase
MTTLVMINGQIVPAKEATISVFDRGFLYGDSVFETVRTYGGRPFALEKHLARLERSAALVFIDLPIAKTKLAEEIEQVVEAAANEESYIRVIVTRGQGELGLDPALAITPNRLIIVASLAAPPESIYQQGVKVVSFRTQRVTDATAAEGAKVGNYLVSVLAMREAKKVGAAEALITDAHGRVVEGASSNVFFVRGGVLHTPPVEAGILPGITRAYVLEAAEALGLSVVLASPKVTELQAADEVFISSSIRELFPVIEVDGEVIGNGLPGGLTQKLHTEFRRRARALD